MKKPLFSGSIQGHHDMITSSGIEGRLLGGGPPPAGTPRNPSPDFTPHDVNDGAYWQQPPLGEGGAPLWVDLRFRVWRVGKVNTVTATAFIQINAVCFWTDPRLAGWPEGAVLPQALWGPRLKLANLTVGPPLQEVPGTFLLVDSSTGRLKRGRSYTGIIDNPMQLRNFPFDMDRIEVQFRTTSHWQSLDNKHCGATAQGKTYRLRQTREHGEGKWLNIGWSGALGEWILHGISTKIEEHQQVDSENAERTRAYTNIPLSLHVSRRHSYYFWKALLPLYLLTGLSMADFYL